MPWVIGIGRFLPIVASGHLIFAGLRCNSWSNLLGQNQLSLLGSTQSIDLAVVLNPNFFATTA
jgi:hypothetical protein